jgi:hypothetical protein
MAVQIVNSGAAIKITTNGAVRRILKSQIWEISVIKTNVIKLDLGQGALHNIYINFSDVDSPVTATPDALCDNINNMMQSLVSGGATEQNQLSEITQLQNISNGISSLSTAISSGGSGGSSAFNEALIVDESNPNIIYRGYAVAGANVAAAVWAIKKTVSNANGDVTTTTWADGNQNFDNIWNNRATLVYS